jgi:transposase
MKVGEVDGMSGETRLFQGNPQLEMGFAVAPSDAPDRDRGRSEERFLTGAEGEFYLGAQSLDQYLEASQQGWVLRLARLLSELDYAPFTGRYQASGRRPIHPRVLLGLVVYGMMQGKWSLRELERLALVDLGAWWISGRLQPDHSTIGKFIQLHEQVLSTEFFTALVKHLVTKLHLSAGTAAMDGTVIEAAASHYRVLRAEALREAHLSEPAQRILEQREAARELNGHGQAGTALAPQEPEAMVQPTKQGVSRPSYKPSALRDESGLVIAQAVHPSSETAVVGELLRQHLAVFAVAPARLLGDAGYHSIELLEELTARNLDVLIAAGRGSSARPWQQRRRKFGKSEFRYDAERDIYHYRGQRTLVREQRGRDTHGRTYLRYRSRDCSGCALRAQCTESARGRTLKRYRGEEYKEAMAEVLQQPAALRQWRRRAGIIEPLFADLRERQRMTRFHRRGLKNVALEFALHCAAYNLRKVARGTAFVMVFSLYIRVPGTDWQLTALGAMIVRPQI